MVEVVSHYFKRESVPFRSLSALPEYEALQLMEELSDDSPIFSRFKTPIEYLQQRRETEAWLRETFVHKGGKPKEKYPIYAVVGRSSWIEQYAAHYGVLRMELPMSLFDIHDISFTYPDSMVSYWLGKDQPANYYIREYHGQVFTLREINNMVDSVGLSGERLNRKLPSDVAPYWEAQIWNRDILRKD